VVWDVVFHDEFEAEFQALSEVVQDALLVRAKVLAEVGPALARPYVDTLKGSAHANMKELRFDAAGGVWRVAFAFDTDRNAVLLVAGNKGSVNQAKFYRSLIATADTRYRGHLSAKEK